MYCILYCRNYKVAPNKSRASELEKKKHFLKIIIVNLCKIIAWWWPSTITTTSVVIIILLIISGFYTGGCVFHKKKLFSNQRHFFFMIQKFDSIILVINFFNFFSVLNFTKMEFLIDFIRIYGNCLLRSKISVDFIDFSSSCVYVRSGELHCGF